MNKQIPISRIDEKARNYLLIMYALNGAYFFTIFITPIVAVILAYVKQSEWEDSVYRDHVAYIIRTFWVSLLVFVISIPLILLFGLGLVTLTLIGVWFAYRSAFGAWRIWQYQGVNPKLWLELP